MLTKSALAELERLANEKPDAVVIWCADCGHIYADSPIQTGDENCARTVATGSPSECIKQMIQ